MKRSPGQGVFTELDGEFRSLRGNLPLDDLMATDTCLPPDLAFPFASSVNASFKSPTASPSLAPEALKPAGIKSVPLRDRLSLSCLAKLSLILSLAPLSGVIVTLGSEG